MNTNHLPEQERKIRVFVSSTFRDMKAERDYLVKFTFPQLRQLCESRGVTCGEVDLRWGVTDEEAADGKVLHICLEEIGRCRPYFIGVLGERYGWVPQDISNDLIAQQPWLEQYRHHSVTELEIIHGVLRNGDMKEHAFFYFRDPAVVAGVSVEERDDFTSENPEFAEMLQRLKRKIRCAEQEGICHLREPFMTPGELGAWVLEDFKEIIDERWPEGSQPSELDRERMDHEAYARSRAQVYIGRAGDFRTLDLYAAGKNDKPMVVLGESGAGKSALLANWALRYRQDHPDTLIIQHYVGASRQSADWASMLRRIMGEFKNRLEVEAEIPGDAQKLRERFPYWLHMAAAKGPVILIIDALNQLEDRDGALGLAWLPPVIPEGLRLLVSTLDGRPLQETRRRKWPEMSVQLLPVDERKELVERYLGERAKKLSDARRHRIAAAPQSANPLYLRVLLDELCVTADHEKLDERIDRYLTAPGPAELYEKVIARWEDDYEGNTDLVGDALSLICASRRGLSEVELLEALGDANGPLPRANWSPLYLAIANALVDRSGLLFFAHDYLRTAVRKSYLPAEKHRRRAHMRLAEYFAKQPGMSPRKAEEWPWQLYSAESWDELLVALCDVDLFLQFYDEKTQWELTAYWQPLRQRGANMAALLASTYEHWKSRNSHSDLTDIVAHQIGSFLTNNGCFTHAQRLLEEAYELGKRESGEDDASTLGSLAALAHLQFEKGDYRASVATNSHVLEKYETIYGASSEKAMGILSNLGAAVGYTGDVKRSWEIGARVLAWQIEHLGSNHPSSILGLHNLAFDELKNGRVEDAERTFRKALDLARENLGADHPWTLLIMNNLGRVIAETRRPKEALGFHEQAEDACARVLGPDHPQTLLFGNDLAMCLRDLKEWDRAREKFRRVYEGRRSVLGEDHPHTILSRSNLKRCK